MIKHILNIFTLLNKKEKIIVFFSIMLGLLNTIFESFSVALIIPILYSFNITDNSKALFENDYLNFFFSMLPENIYYLLIIFFSVFLIKNLFLIYSIFLQNSLKNKLIEKNSNKLVFNYQNLQFDIISLQKNHKIERNLRKGLFNMVGTVLLGSMSIIIDLSLFISFLILLFIINPAPVFFSIILILFITLIYKKIIITKIKLLGKKTAELSADYFKNLLNILNGYKEFRIFSKKTINREILLKNLEEYNKNNLIFLILSSLPRIIFELFPLILIILIIYYLEKISKISLNEAIIVLATFTFAFIRLIPYFSKFLTTIQDINYNLKYSEDTFDQIKKFEKMNTKTYSEKIEKFESLTFENLKFKYQEEKEIIDIEKFEIKKGDVIGIFGKSGQGKSSLAEIILGYISPSSGSININLNKKIDLKNCKFEISNSFYLPQNVFIFDEDIFSNVSMNFEQKNFNEKKFKTVFEKTNLIEFSKQKRTLKLGEGGKEISGGEKQRIGFARCLYNNWDLIVLDEATSAMDKQNEKNILDKVVKFKEKSQSIIMISHNREILNEFCSVIYEFKDKKLIKVKKSD